MKFSHKVTQYADVLSERLASEMTYLHVQLEVDSTQSPPQFRQH